MCFVFILFPLQVCCLSRQGNTSTEVSGYAQLVLPSTWLANWCCRRGLGQKKIECLSQEEFQVASLPRRVVWRGVISHREEVQTLPCIYKTHPSDEKHLYPRHNNDEHYVYIRSGNFKQGKCYLKKGWGT